MTLDQNLVAAIAAKFTKDLMSYMTAHQWSEMCAKLHEARYQYPICPSHDYCDANEFMNDAMEALTGQDHDPDSQWQADLWNAAWDHASADWRKAGAA